MSHQYLWSVLHQNLWLNPPINKQNSLSKKSYRFPRKATCWNYLAAKILQVIMDRFLKKISHFSHWHLTSSGQPQSNRAKHPVFNILFSPLLGNIVLWQCFTLTSLYGKRSSNLKAVPTLLRT